MDKSVELLHLSATDRSQYVGEAIVVANFVVNVLDGILLGLGSQVPGVLGPLGVVGNKHSAAAGGDDLISVETEAAGAVESTEALATVHGAETFGGIFDDL